MSVLHLILDGVSTAAELAVLLFLTPIGDATAEPIRSTPAAQVMDTKTRGNAAAPELRPLHLVDAAFGMRLLGPLADVRVVQSLRNDGERAIDLGSQLPSATSDADSVSIRRDGRSLDLLAGSSCGGDDDPNAGHVRAGIDEVIADLMQLPPGQRATIEITATEALQPAGLAWRIDLPATVVPIEAQALVVHQPDGNYLVVVPPHGARGSATVTLRPADSPAKQWDLGPAHSGAAYVIPIGDDRTLPGLAAGAAELELRSTHLVHWRTLPVSLRDGGHSTLARSTH